MFVWQLKPRNILSITIILTLSIALMFSNNASSSPHLAAASKVNTVPRSGGLLTWSPFGPRQTQALFKIYSDPVVTLNNLLSGQIDLADYPVPQSYVMGLQANPDFLVTSPSLCSGGSYEASVSFDASATSGGTPPYGFNWSFGDGGSTAGNPVSHVYASKGPFTVGLTVTDSAGQVSTSLHPGVLVPTSSNSLTAGFSFNPSTPAPGQQVTLTASPTGGTGVGLSYGWDFGDGSPFMAGSPVVHTYPSTGIFVIRLVVTDSGGYVATGRQYISVSSTPTSLIPSFVYSIIPSEYAALEGWDMSSTGSASSSLVADACGGWGAGYGFWSMLNMQPVPGYNPCVPGAPSNCSSLTPGGGTAGLIRRGLSNELFNLNPFSPSLQPNELEITSLVFDSLLKVNPVDPFCHPVVYPNCQVLNWMTTTWTSPVAPANTVVFQLRNDLKFHDGNSVGGPDVCTSIKIEFPFAACVSSGSVVTVVGGPLSASPTTAEIVAVGSVPIIEASLWGACGNVCDPLAQNPSIFIGSGPWECKNLRTGQIGGSCTADASGNLAASRVMAGGIVYLTRFVDPVTAGGVSYMRCCPDDTVTSPLVPRGTSLMKESWADHDNNGIVNILDIADAAFHFGQANAYWDSPLFGCVTGRVDICEVALIAFYFDAGIITHDFKVPYPCSSLLGLDPLINPYQRIPCVTTPSSTPQGLSIPGVFQINQWASSDGTFNAEFAAEASGGVPMYTWNPPTFGPTPFPLGCTPTAAPISGYSWISNGIIEFIASYQASCSPGTYSMTVTVSDSSAPPSTATYGPLSITV